MLKVWGRRNSINVQKVMWTVGELAIPCERIEAGMAFGLVDEPAYRDRNPNGLVPTIDDDGVVLWESNVIVRYLAGKHAPGVWLPNDLALRAKAEMWMDWQQNVVNPAMGPMFLGLVRTPAAQRDQAAIQASVAKTEAALRLLDHHLAGRQYIAAAYPTAADIPLGCVAYRWYALPIERPELPNVKAWYQRLVTRPAFAEHVMRPLT